MSNAGKPGKVEVPMSPELWADLEELRALLRTPSNAETFRAALRGELTRRRDEAEDRKLAERSKAALLSRLAKGA